jgi:tRNA pseudouridine38-40 synthase
MLERTLSFVWSDAPTKTLASGRTDAKVSAEIALVEIFTTVDVMDLEDFKYQLNSNLPPDLKALSVQRVSADFNVIQSVQEKEYHYYFGFGEKAHPYSAPFVFTHIEELDIKLMQTGAKLFEGEHDFNGYCSGKKEGKNTRRNILKSQIVKTGSLQASFFPKEVWVYQVRSKGFLRHQVRLMMGHLFEIGRGEKQLSSIQESLETGVRTPSITGIAPSSGLHLVDLSANVSKYIS